VLLNAAALLVAGRTKSVMEGWELALELIASGKARVAVVLLSVMIPVIQILCWNRKQVP
jgi:anthranilate phosphoribosyltransferase